MCIKGGVFLRCLNHDHWILDDSWTRPFLSFARSANAQRFSPTHYFTDTILPPLNCDSFSRIPLFSKWHKCYPLSSERNRQELQEISSEVRNIGEKLDTQVKEYARNEGKGLEKHYDGTLLPNFSNISIPTYKTLMKSWTLKWKRTRGMEVNNSAR